MSATLKTELIIQAGKPGMTPNQATETTTLPTRMLLSVPAEVSTFLANTGTFTPEQGSSLEDAMQQAAEKVVTENLQSFGLIGSYEHYEQAGEYVMSSQARTFIVGKQENGVLAPFTTPGSFQGDDGDVPFEFRYHIVVRAT